MKLFELINANSNNEIVAKANALVVALVDERKKAEKELIWTFMSDEEKMDIKIEKQIERNWIECANEIDSYTQHDLEMFIDVMSDQIKSVAGCRPNFGAIYHYTAKNDPRHIVLEKWLRGRGVAL